MLDKLEAIFKRWEEVGKQLTEPEIISDMNRYIKLSKDYKELQPIVDAYREYKLVVENIASSKEILAKEKDDEFREMAKSELDMLVLKKNEMEESIRIMLIPSDPEDGKNSIVEIRAGTGGDEASIFAGDLYRMYTRFCENKKWKIELVDCTEGTAGGFKEIIINVSGENVYGRVHTSAASVVVLPEADEFDIDLKQSDIRKDTFCSSGPGGQSVNTTYSAIRLSHIPTNIVVSCQDEKSQIKNLDKAMKVLRSRLYELEYQKYLDDISKKRKTMVSTGDRSAKIRTYNYPQSRVTDHRIGLSFHNLPSFMDGAIQEMIDALQLAENAERLKAAGEE